MHSAVGNALSRGWEAGLYLWAPGPRSLGSRDGSPSNSVSEVGFPGNSDRVGYNLNRAEHKLVFGSSEAADIRAMVRERKLRGAQDGVRRGDEADMGRKGP